jgi:hypothetical protein|tara:strand:- start:187 stop:339 length:153 start_codon:yes stop_codon:yes gene_type:complete
VFTQQSKVHIDPIWKPPTLRDRFDKLRQHLDAAADLTKENCVSVSNADDV